MNDNQELKARHRRLRRDYARVVEVLLEALALTLVIGVAVGLYALVSNILR